MDYKLIVAGGRVNRFHSDYMINRQDVAQHSFQCALLAHSIVEFYNEHASTDYQLDTHRIVMHMLLHDIPEYHVGDVPGYIKSGNPVLGEIFQDMEEKFAKERFSNLEYLYFADMQGIENTIIRFVDLYDCAMTSLHQCKIGNKEGMDAIAINCAEGFRKVIDKMDSMFDETPNVIPEDHLNGLFALRNMFGMLNEQYIQETEGVL